MFLAEWGAVPFVLLESPPRIIDAPQRWFKGKAVYFYDLRKWHLLGESQLIVRSLSLSRNVYLTRGHKSSFPVFYKNFCAYLIKSLRMCVCVCVGEIR